jgi:hypothetical protein
MRWPWLSLRHLRCAAIDPDVAMGNAGKSKGFHAGPVWAIVQVAYQFITETFVFGWRNQAVPLRATHLENRSHA